MTSTQTTGSDGLLK